MQDIVRESGLSPGALYGYFDSKEQMIEAIAAERHARERDIIRDAGAKGEVAAVLRDLIHRFGESLLDPGGREERRLAMQLWTEALRNPRILETVRKGVGRATQAAGRDPNSHPRSR
jgi:AcrR family transcriptional regulator